jgi:hypothetical protein
MPGGGEGAKGNMQILGGNSLPPTFTVLDIFRKELGRQFPCHNGTGMALNESEQQNTVGSKGMVGETVDHWGSLFGVHQLLEFSLFQQLAKLTFPSSWRHKGKEAIEEIDECGDGHQQKPKPNEQINLKLALICISLVNAIFLPFH